MVYLSSQDLGLVEPFIDSSHLNTLDFFQEDRLIQNVEKCPHNLTALRFSESEEENLLDPSLHVELHQQLIGSVFSETPPLSKFHGSPLSSFLTM